MFEIILIANSLSSSRKLVGLDISSFIISYSRSNKAKTPGVSSKRDPSFASCKMKFSLIAATHIWNWGGVLKPSYLVCFFRASWFLLFLSFPLLQNTPSAISYPLQHTFSRLLLELSKPTSALASLDPFIGHRWIFPQTLRIYWHSTPTMEKQPVNMCVPYLLCKAFSWVNSVYW